MSIDKYANESTEKLQQTVESLKKVTYILIGFQIVLLAIGVYLISHGKTSIAIPVALIPAIILPGITGVAGKMTAIKKELKKREQPS